MATVTIFKNISDVSNPNYVGIDTIIDRIRSGKSKGTLEKVRAEKDKSERNKIKKSLPSIIFAGKCGVRTDEGLLESSGLMSIDFDDFDTTEALESKRFELEFDEYTYLLFTSPSGDGLKVIVKIPEDLENYRKYFRAIEKYYNCPHFDTKCVNVSRVCYESYDPDIFVNNNSTVWTEQYEPPIVEQKKIDIPIESKNKIVKILETWWNDKYGMLDGQKNSNLYILAASFNTFGIDPQEALDELLKYDEGGKYEEITLIRNSAYKKTENFGSKQFEDLDKVDDIMKLQASGVPTERIAELYPAIPIEAIESIAERQTIGSEFWYINNKQVVSIINHKYRKFLSDNGFHKLYPSGSHNFVLVRVLDNTMVNVTDEMIKSFTLDYLEEADIMAWDHYAGKKSHHKEDFLSFLPQVSPNFMKDDKETAYLYYRNCAVRVTKSGLEPISYRDIDGCIWEEQKIPRDFSITKNPCEFQTFVQNVSGNETERYRAVESTIGYLLHSYKPQGFCPAVILNDETISDNPEGGTGKGIFVKAIGYVKKNVIIDGKGFSFQKTFLYQRVSADTQILTYDDVQRGFEFERLFSVITEGITLEKKNKDEIHIPFDESPKVIITTNYALKGAGNSHDRRKWELEFAQHYNKHFTPEDEFGHQLFADWDKEEWARFDNYMVGCLQGYLNTGLIESPFKNLGLRKLEAATSYEFREWITSSDKDRKYIISAGSSWLGTDLLSDFTMEYPDYSMHGKVRLSNKTFYKWLNYYAKYKFGEPISTSRSASGVMVKFTQTDKQSKLNFK